MQLTRNAMEAGAAGFGAQGLGSTAKDNQAFGHVIRRRVVEEMFRSVRKSEAEWNVLVMDELTTKVVSSVVRMSEILDDGISLVEDIEKNREPFPSMNGIYFIQPRAAAVKTLIADFKSERKKLYKKAHVFFTSTVPQALLALIKASPELIKNLATLKQVNLELLLVDNQSFITGQVRRPPRSRARARSHPPRAERPPFSL